MGFLLYHQNDLNIFEFRDWGKEMVEGNIFNPLVSVIVPVYNVEKYLDRCVKSILDQTYENIEIILVDDGSTDTSGEICEKYALRDKRINVIHKENDGLVSARKTGIRAATGTYVAYVDSDDWIDKTMYEELVKEIVQHNADIVTSGLYREYHESTVTEFDHLSEGVYERELIENKIFPKLMFTGNFFESGINIHLYNKLYKRDLVKRNQLNIDSQVRVGDDAALVYPCIMDAQKIIIIHKCFYHYCIRRNSVMSTGYKNEISGYKQIYNIIKKKIAMYSKWEDILGSQLKFLMIYLLLLKEPQYIIRVRDNQLIPFDCVYIKEKVVLCGNGKFGNALYRFIKEESLCEVVLRIDKLENIEERIFDFSKLNLVPKKSYDKVVIAVLVDSVAKEIYEQLIKMGIEEKKIVKLNIESKGIVKSDMWNTIFER